MQYSTRTLLIVAAVVAVLLACLVYPEPFIGDLFYTAGLLVLGVGIIAAIYARGRQRAFLIGFLVLFGIYSSQSVWFNNSRLLLGINIYGQPGTSARYSQGLITTRLLSYAYEALSPDFFSGRPVASRRPSSSMSQQDIYLRYGSFMLIGHTVIGLALGVAGGWLAQRMVAPVPPTAGRPLEKILDDMDL
jgi:hypothetical protein